ncbi:MAG: hypothetical protein Phog2KO_29480 [Phototrophicaceae bacterium]
MIRSIRLTWMILLIAIAGIASAQEDLSWLLPLIPDSNDIDIAKQVEQGAVSVLTGDVLLEESFTALNAWESASDRAGNRRVRNDRYEIRLVDNDIIYTGIGTSEYDNTIITVDTQRLSTEPNDGYGLVCRASDEENGIYFYISSDGFWRIFAFIDGRAQPFMPWTASELINQGEEANNRITAVCVDNYFALYINGELAGEARDNTFDEGAVGMSVIVFEENSEVFIGFDNLRIWSADADDNQLTTLETSSNNANSDTLASEQRSETILLLEDGSEDVSLDTLLHFDNMDTASNWRVIDADQGEVDFDDGILEITSNEDALYPIMLLTDDAYDNVVIQASMTFENGADNNAYGLVCRSSENNIARGYQFMISGDGYYSIWLTDSAVYRLVVDWERSTAINLNSENQLTAVCIDDYIAFYINDTLLVDIYDDVYQGGSVGLVAFTFEDDTEVSADDVYIWSAEIR